MATAVASTNLWDELARRCTAAGAYSFGVSLLDVLARMSVPARQEFLGQVVAHAAAAAEGVRTREGLEFDAWAQRAFGDHADNKLRALDEFLELRAELPAFTVDEFFREVVGVAPPAASPSVVPAGETGLPTLYEVESEEQDGGVFVGRIPASDAARIDRYLRGEILQPKGDYAPFYELHIPLTDAYWAYFLLCSGARGPYVDAFVEDGAGMERFTWPPRDTLLGEYPGEFDGRVVKIIVQAEG